MNGGQSGLDTRAPGVDLSYIDQLPPWLTFDQFGRYSLLREALAAARGPLGSDTLSILDVGGWTRHILGEGLPILHFLPDDEVLVVDQVECALPHYRRADGTNLDFPDNAFDFVTSADTLEHIPGHQRERFVHELVRVSRYGVLLIAPFKHPVVDAAEEFLFDYIKAELGITQQQLAEHRGYGLPDLEAIKAQLGRMGLACHSYPSGYIHSWLAMMVAKHYLFGLTDDPQIHMRVDRYYIQWLATDERREPSYRHYVVTAKDNRGDWLAEVESALRPTIRTDSSSDRGSWEQTVNWLIDLLTLKRTGGTRQEKEQAASLQQTIGTQQQQIDHLLQMLAQRDGQIADLQRRSLWQSEVIEDLRLQVGRLANGRLMRLLNWLTHKH